MLVVTATPIAPITVASTVLPIGASTSSKTRWASRHSSTGASYDPPTGGSGLFGWMSGIYKEIVSGIKLKLGGADVSSSNPLPVALVTRQNSIPEMNGNMQQQVVALLIQQITY